MVMDLLGVNLGNLASKTPQSAQQCYLCFVMASSGDLLANTLVKDAFAILL